MLLFSEHSEEGLLLLVRIDTVDCVSKLAVLATRRTPYGASLCVLGANSQLLAAEGGRRCFLICLTLGMPISGRARGTMSTW